MWLIAALTTLALADEPAYRTCCAELNAGLCPNFLEIIGPTSSTSTPARSNDAGVQATEVRGIWALTCEDGAAWFPAATRHTAPGALEGDVLTPISATAAECFAAACSLPARLCVRHVHGRTQVVGCDTGGPAELSAWEDTRLTPTSAVVAGNRVVRAIEVSADGDPVAHSATASASTVETRSSAQHSPVWNAPPEPRTTTIARTAPTPPPPRALEPAAVDTNLPDPPPAPCVVQPHLRQPSIDQVELGDERFVAGEMGLALGHYRAAITINQCNPFAWAQLGTAMLEAGAAEPAEAALQYATRLMPQHFRAWTDLGRAREKRGEHVQAIAAFQEALTVRPGYIPAEAGLRRSIRNR